MADALSHLPPDITDLVPDVDPKELQTPLWSSWMNDSFVNAVLQISTDKVFLQKLKASYSSDEFCKKFVSGKSILPNI